MLRGIVPGALVRALEGGSGSVDRLTCLRSGRSPTCVRGRSISTDGRLMLAWWLTRLPGMLALALRPGLPP